MLSDLGVIEPIITDEIRTNFPNFMKYDAIPNAQVEYEVRFGHKKNGIFDSQLLYKNRWYSVYDHLNRYAKRYPTDVNVIETNYQVQINKEGYRRIADKTINKVRDMIIDNDDWGIRFAKSYEIENNTTEPFESVIERNFKRISFIDNRKCSYFYGFKIDLSIVEMNDQIRYELEIEARNELLDELLIIDKWWAAIKCLYGWMLNAKTSLEIISLKEQLYVGYLLNYYLNHSSNSFHITSDMVNRPITLMQLYLARNHFLSIKYNGLHKILLASKSGVYLCSSELNITKIAPGVNCEPSIAEGEYMVETGIFIMFDILISNGISVTNKTFEERQAQLKSLIISLSNPKMVQKSFYKPTDISQAMIEYKNSNNDGFIFYSSGTYFQTIWKWKPLHQLSIDFHITVINDRWIPQVFNKGKLSRFKKYTVSSTTFTTDQVNGKIVECVWSNYAKCWIPIKIRPDKLFPNSRKVAFDTFKMIYRPITLGQILNFFLPNSN